MKNFTTTFRIILVILFLLFTTIPSFSEDDYGTDNKTGSALPLTTSNANTATIGGYNVYYGHLHNHSNVSDGTGTPDDAYNYAKNTAGLDFFGLSDHANQIGTEEWPIIKTAADKYNEDGVFATFRGFEWSHNTLGHVTIINTDDYCTRTSVPTFPGLLSWVNTRDCAAFFNHPGRQNGTNEEFGQFLDAPSDKFVGMELWNKNDLYDNYYYNDGYYAGDGNLGYFDEALSRDWKIGAGGSEDNHGGTWGTYNDCNMAVLANSLTRADIYEAIKNKRFFSTLDKNIKMSFKINGNEMGSTLEGNIGQGLQILVSDDDGENISKVELYKNGILENTWNPGISDVNITGTISTSDGEFYYIKVTQPDGDEAISSPVFIEGGMTNTPPVCAITNPEDGTHFNSTQTITITADASDSDGTITQVEFFVDDVSLGSDNTSPYSIDWVIPSNGGYSLTIKATDNFGATKTSELVNINVGEYTEAVSVQIASGNDDAEEAQDGRMYLTSSDLELVYDTYNDNFLQTVGLRFTDLNIPQGAIISSAFVQFTVDEASSGTTSLTISGHNSDDSPAFTSTTNNISDRTKTSNSVIWSPQDWSTVGTVGTAQQTPNLSAIIQEIVDRQGFSSASAISLFINGTETTKRVAQAYELANSNPAVLNIEYLVGTPNEAPIFYVNPIVEIDGTQDVVYNGSIAMYASDPEGDALYFSKVSGPDWLNVAANGDLSGTPLYYHVGPNSWTVRVDDEYGNYTWTELQINVIDVNDAPETVSDPIIEQDANEDVPYLADISLYFSDKDGDLLTFTKTSGPIWLSIENNSGVISGTPTQNDVGENLWTVQVSDGKAAINVDLEIIVNNINDNPYFVSLPLVKSDASEDTEYSESIEFDAFDEDGDLIMFSIAQGPEWLQMSEDGKLSGTPEQVHVGINQWTIEASDGNGGLAVTELQITVLNVNDQPSWTDDPILETNATEGVPYFSSIADNISDEDGDIPTFTILGEPGWLILSSNGDLSGTPWPGDVGLNSWTIQADDGNGEIIQGILRINVLDFNYPPQFTADPFSPSGAYEDSPYSTSIAGSATDADNDVLVYSKVSGPAWLSIATDGTLSGTPIQSDVGVNSFVVQVSDGNGGTNQAIMEITVINTNDAPVFNKDTLVLADAFEDAAYSGSIAGDISDPDGDSYTFVKKFGPDWMIVDSNGNLSGTPTSDDIGINIWTIEAADGNGGITWGTVQITVQEVNYPPQFASDPIVLGNANEDIVFIDSLTGFVSDPDQDVLTYSKVSGPTWLILSSNGHLNGTPLQSDVGTNNFTVEVSDGKETDQATLVIEVINTNDAPIFNVDPIVEADATEDEAYSASIAGSATDEDGDVLSYSKISGPEWLTVSSSGTLAGTPSNSDIGPNSWTVQVIDGNEGADTATVNIPVNGKPVIIYCTSSGNTDSEFIKTVQINGETNNSEDNGGYKFFDDWQTIHLETATSVSLALTPGFYGRSTHQYWAVWIDFDQNGFDAGDLVYSSSKSKSTVYGSFTTSTDVGITRMRISMSNSGTPPVCGSFGGGEVEDYLLNIQQAGVNPPVAYFSADPTSIMEGETVIFTDQSTNNPTSWSWNFGNGQTSISQNPSATYSNAGTYTVSLTATNSAGSDVETKASCITVTAPSTDPPVADFSASPTSVYVNGTVQFTDESTNATGWTWSFGDTNTSTEQNPTHSYTVADTYSVTLTATNANGNDVLTKTGYIVVSEAPISLYCEPVIDNSADYINSININGTTNASGKDTEGFTFFTSPEFDLVAGETYTFVLEPANPKNRNFWRIWIDANGDGTFIDANETLYVGNNKKGTVTGTITIPADIKVSNTRLRISMKTGSSQAPCDNFNGEVEDYIVNITHPDYKSATIATFVDVMETDIKTSLKVYPNPFFDEINISIDGSNDYEKAIVHVLDITGKVMFTEVYGNQRKIVIRNLPLTQGIYLIRVNLGEFVKTEQLIKTR